MRAFEKSLADFGIGFTRDQYKALYTPAWTVMYEGFGLPKSHWTEADERWLFHFREEQPVLLPGAAEVLTKLAAAGMTLGLVTGATRGRLERELSRLGLDSTFASVIGHEDVVNKKPHPEGIETSLERLKASRESCCMVGDSPDDISMGRSAGIRTVAVRSDYVHPERLDDCGADHLLQCIAELPSICGR
jgi:HAD superfamily hydrolase (TIGR01509 family)